MKNKQSIIIIIAGFVFLFITLYFLFFVRITEKKYNGIMCYYIAHNVTLHSKGFEDKVVALRDFVHENIHPLEGYHNRLDTVATEKLISGIGWCDQQARVFIQLARSIGIKSRLLFLRSESGDSPHSVAEAFAPDNRWIIVDPMFRLDLLTKSGKLASQDDIRNDPSIISNNKRVRLRAEYDPSWSDPKFLAIYSNPPSYIMTKRGIKFDFFKRIPLTWIRPIVNIIQDRYFNQFKQGINDIYEFRMIKARGYHLLGYYDRSEIMYRDIIKNSNNLQLTYKAEFYYAVLLKDKAKYEEADKYISETTKKIPLSPYMPYLLDVRARILEKMGRCEETTKF